MSKFRTGVEVEKPTWLIYLKSHSPTQLLSVQASLRDIAGSESHHHNKVNIQCFGFPVHVKVMFALRYSLLNVQ